MSASLLFFSSTLVYITVSARTPPRARATSDLSATLAHGVHRDARRRAPRDVARAGARAGASRLASATKGATLQGVYTLRSAPHRRAALKGPLLRARHGARHASWRPYTCVLLFTYFVFLNCIQFSTHVAKGARCLVRAHTL